MTRSTAELWLIIAAIAAGTFAMRLSFVAWMGRMGAPRWLTRTVRFIPPAVLAALITPAVLDFDAAASTGALAVPTAAAALALLVACRTRSLLLPIATGMAVLWVLRASLPG